MNDVRVPYAHLLGDRTARPLTDQEMAKVPYRHLLANPRQGGELTAKQLAAAVIAAAPGAHRK
jgi:hypothetical protein